MDIKIVDLLKEPMDNMNYGYACCDCLYMHEGVRVDRPDDGGYVKFDCPRCGRSLGIALSSKRDYAKYCMNEEQ